MKCKLIILLLSIMCTILCSCTYTENVTYIKPNDDRENAYLIYQENEYYAEPIFSANGENGQPNQGDVEIGRFYSFPFGTDFYSYAFESPDYIYSTGFGKDVYLKQGFDYNSEVFLIDKISEPFVFSDVLTKAELKIQYDFYDIVLRSQKYPDLKIETQLHFDNDNWYFVCKSDVVYLISPSLVEALKENAVI